MSRANLVGLLPSELEDLAVALGVSRYRGRQLLAANALLGEEGHVTHVVFMGMGEPLANYASLVAALKIMIDPKLGLAYSPRRLTVSTVGLVSGIDKLGREDLRVNLAISLHA